MPCLFFRTVRHSVLAIGDHHGGVKPGSTAFLLIVQEGISGVYRYFIGRVHSW